MGRGVDLDTSSGHAQARPPASRRVVLIVASTQMPDCFVHAIERQFRAVQVVQSIDGEADRPVRATSVELVLVEGGLFEDLHKGLAELQGIYATAAFALLQTAASRSLAIQEVLAIPRLNGVLPMDLKLDLWLSVLQILLQGGTYIPSPLIAASLSRPSGRAPSGPADPPWGNRSDRRLKILTDRELQILELVSTGLQNKLIAGRLGLSENTIKIHLHNIITKLGAHNRTEAASMFRDRLAPSQRPLPAGLPRS